MSAQQGWTSPELRSQDELKAMLAHVAEHGYGRTSRTYVQGIAEALEWATGARGMSPVTRRSLGRPPTGPEVSNEHSRAYDALYATSDPELWKVTQERGQDFTLAVEHTLAWATGGDTGLVVPANWPWPQAR
ncbi:hypothetical protein [Streptomyces niveiscabiei]|uniref:hypothetical protein n=1 Tax=Streptomyces niveiscabiei TaxID=164115 RepID=UPI0038F7FFD5